MLSRPKEPHTGRKVYFIKRPKPGHELTTLLKNKFKSIDAIRDILGWYGAQRDFHIVLTDWAPELDDEPPQTIPISPSLPDYENNRNIASVIENIIFWLDDGRDFDIMLSPTDPFLVNLN